MASFRNLWRFQGDNCANVLITKLPQIEIQTMAKRTLNYVQYQKMVKKDKEANFHEYCPSHVPLPYHFYTTKSVTFQWYR